MRQPAIPCCRGAAPVQHLRTREVTWIYNFASRIYHDLLVLIDFYYYWQVGIGESVPLSHHPHPLFRVYCVRSETEWRQQNVSTRIVMSYRSILVTWNYIVYNRLVNHASFNLVTADSSVSVDPVQFPFILRLIESVGDLVIVVLRQLHSLIQHLAFVGQYWTKRYTPCEKHVHSVL